MVRDGVMVAVVVRMRDQSGVLVQEVDESHVRVHLVQEHELLRLEDVLSDGE